MSGLPAIIRPSFTLGGTGGGIAYNQRGIRGDRRAAACAPRPAHEVLIEESVLGWKEFEMEVVRDRADNCIIICSIENVDPMGVHTGDCVTVAPALTLTDKEYQIMRNASIAVLREIGVDTGGSNVQFAVNPADGRLVIIEMNPRVSRSSALASKATGFPIAKVAAKLAVGYTLDELKNEITRVTPASFEPTIDYVVTKMPRFTFEKFPGAEPLLTTSMKSVGEAMAIGRSFAESVQKALRSMETGLTGFNEVEIAGARRRRQERDPRRAGQADAGPAAGHRPGLSPRPHHRRRSTPPANTIPGSSKRSARSSPPRPRCARSGLPADAPGSAALEAHGFFRCAARPSSRASSEARGRGAARARSASIRSTSASTPAPPSSRRSRLTCTRPMRATGVARAECEAEPTDRDKVVILGGGPNRIGQGIEFDYCCVHAAYSLKEAGIETIMVNCNPGDRLDRLRHLRPALFRAADRRGRDRAGARRAAPRQAAQA